MVNREKSGFGQGVLALYKIGLGLGIGRIEPVPWETFIAFREKRYAQSGASGSALGNK
jgi:hypothetical protein